MALTHSQIRANLLSLILEAGESMIGYGYMRVLETLIDIAEHEGAANALVSSTLPALNNAMLAASTAGTFEVIDSRDLRSPADICRDMHTRGITITCADPLA